MSDADKINARMGIYGGFTKETGLDAGIDRFENMQEPDFKPVDDLTRFVKARVIEAELEPRGEVLAMYDEPAGAMAHRYAGYVRRDMVAFRNIAAMYCATYSGRSGLTAALLAVANRWADHRDFLEQWRME